MLRRAHEGDATTTRTMKISGRPSLTRTSKLHSTTRRCTRQRHHGRTAHHPHTTIAVTARRECTHPWAAGRPEDRRIPAPCGEQHRQPSRPTGFDRTQHHRARPFLRASANSAKVRTFLADESYQHPSASYMEHWLDAAGRPAPSVSLEEATDAQADGIHSGDSEIDGSSSSEE